MALGAIQNAYLGAVARLPPILGGTPQAPTPAPAGAGVLAPAVIPMVPPGGLVPNLVERPIIDYVESHLGDAIHTPGLREHLREKIIDLARNHGIATRGQFDRLNKAAGINAWTRNLMAGVYTTTMGFSVSALAGMTANALLKLVDDPDQPDPQREAMAYAIGATMGFIFTEWAGVGTAAAANYVKTNKLGPNYHANRAGEYEGVFTKKFLQQQLPFFWFSAVHVAGETQQWDLGPDKYVSGGIDFGVKRFVQAQVAAALTTLTVAVTQMDNRPIFLANDKLIEGSLSTLGWLDKPVGEYAGGAVAIGKEMVSWMREAFTKVLRLDQAPFIAGVMTKGALANAMVLSPTAALYAWAGGQALKDALHSKLSGEPIGDPAARYVHQLRQAGNAGTLIEFWILRQAAVENWPFKSFAPPEMAHGTAANYLSTNKTTAADSLVGAGPIANWIAIAGGTHPTADLVNAARQYDFALSANAGGPLAVAANLVSYQEYDTAKGAYHQGDIGFKNNDWTTAALGANLLVTAVNNMLADAAVTADANFTSLVAARNNLGNAMGAANNPHGQALAAYQPFAPGAISVTPGSQSLADDLLRTAEISFNALANANPAMLTAVAAHFSATRMVAAELAIQAAARVIPGLMPAGNPAGRAALGAQRDALLSGIQTLINEGTMLLGIGALPAGHAAENALDNALATVEQRLDEGDANTTNIARRVSKTELVNMATTLVNPNDPANLPKSMLAELIEARLSLPRTDKDALKPDEIAEVLRPLLTTVDFANFGTGGGVVERIKYSTLGMDQLYDLSKTVAAMPPTPQNNEYKSAVLKLIAETIGSAGRRSLWMGRGGEDAPRQFTDLLKPWLVAASAVPLTMPAGHIEQLSDIVRDLLTDNTLALSHRDDLYGWASTPLAPAPAPGTGPAPAPANLGPLPQALVNALAVYDAQAWRVRRGNS